jgi:hypothetical protein
VAKFIRDWDGVSTTLSRSLLQTEVGKRRLGPPGSRGLAYACFRLRHPGNGVMSQISRFAAHSAEQNCPAALEAPIASCLANNLGGADTSVTLGTLWRRGSRLDWTRPCLARKNHAFGKDL